MKIHRSRWASKVGAAVSAAALLGALIPILAGASSAGLSGLSGAASAATCPTEAYSGQPVNCATSTSQGSSTVAPTSTTASTAPLTTLGPCSSSGITLTASYSAGHVLWQVSGFPQSAVGTTVDVFLAGVLLGSGTVSSSGCALGGDPDCLKAGTYPIAAIDGSLTADATVTVSSTEACLASSTGSSSKSGGGGLAFTGGQIALLVALALLLIVLGATVFRLARQRRGLQRS
jgi:hypothetical protein